MNCSDKADAEEGPNCAIPDCEFKACLSLDSELCYRHATGLPPITMAEYERRHAEGPCGEPGCLCAQNEADDSDEIVW